MAECDFISKSQNDSESIFSDWKIRRSFCEKMIRIVLNPNNGRITVKSTLRGHGRRLKINNNFPESCTLKWNEKSQLF